MRIRSFKAPAPTARSTATPGYTTASLPSMGRRCPNRLAMCCWCMICWTGRRTKPSVWRYSQPIIGGPRLERAAPAGCATVPEERFQCPWRIGAAARAADATGRCRHGCPACAYKVRSAGIFRDVGVAAAGPERIDVARADVRIVALGDLQGSWSTETTLDSTGLHVLPGVIDNPVHFREHGLTHKEDLESGTRGAARGVASACSGWWI